MTFIWFTSKHIACKEASLINRCARACDCVDTGSCLELLQDQVSCNLLPRAFLPSLTTSNVPGENNSNYYEMGHS